MAIPKCPSLTHSEQPNPPDAPLLSQHMHPVGPFSHPLLQMWVLPPRTDAPAIALQMRFIQGPILSRNTTPAQPCPAGFAGQTLVMGRWDLCISAHGVTLLRSQGKRKKSPRNPQTFHPDLGPSKPPAPRGRGCSPPGAFSLP